MPGMRAILVVDRTMLLSAARVTLGSVRTGGMTRVIATLAKSPQGHIHGHT